MNESAIFHSALQRHDPDERAAYLDAACAGDPALRDLLDELLQAYARLEGFLEAPPPGLATTGPLGPNDATPTEGSPQTTPFGHAGESAGVVVAGRYRLVRRLGEGGMGTVWLADQLEPVRRPVALKVVKEGRDGRRVLARFEAERQALALMTHPHIAKVLDAGATAAGRPFFVMEVVEGPPITAYCDDRKFTVPDRLRLFVDVCEAVQHAHQKGIIHRDLKPSNVLVAEVDGHPVPKVIDFGLAKALSGQPLTDRTADTAVGVVMGTPLYMAPEQADPNAVDVDTRADVYALGVVLYELLTGTTPLDRDRVAGASWDELRRMIREEEPPPPSPRLGSATPPDSAGRTRLVRGDLDWIAMKALAKERERRYPTAAALAEDVGRYLRDEPVAAGPPSRWYRVRKFVKRNKGRVVAAGLVLLALVGGVIGTSVGLVRALDAERTAKDDRDAKQKALDLVVVEQGKTKDALVLAEGRRRTPRRPSKRPGSPVVRRWRP